MLAGENSAVSITTMETTNIAEGRTSLWSQWRVRSDRSTIELTDSKSNTTSLPLSKETQNTHYNRVFSYSLDKVPEGNYTTATVSIEDNFGNITTKVIDDLFVIDNTAPKISIFNNNKSIVDNEMIVGLEAIKIELADSNNPQIKSILLEGGPAKDKVSLATRKEGKNSYMLEYPRIFPALKSGEEYSLTVEATDRFGNVSSKKVSFLYQPTDLVDFGRLDMLSVDRPLLLPDNEPINVAGNRPSTNE